MIDKRSRIMNPQAASERSWYRLHGLDFAYCAVLALLAMSLFLAAKIQVLPLVEGPVTFDGQYYLSIAEEGYSFDSDIEKKQNMAFLPLTAAQIRVAEILVPGSNKLLEVMLAGSVVLFGTLLGIFSLCSGLATPTAARLATLLWAASPLSLYNFVGYSEPIFALLCVWAFVALYRKSLWTATILAALALLARPQAMVLAIFVIFALLDHAKWRPAVFFGGPAPLQISMLVAPLMAFASWQVVKFGDAAAYVNALEAWRRGSFMDGNLTAGPAFLHFFDAVSSGAGSLGQWTTLLTSLSLAIVTGAIAFAGGAPRMVVAFYAASLLFWLASASFDANNIARHTFFMFPWVVLIGIAISRLPGRERGKYLLLSPALLVAAVVNFQAVIRYYRGEWVS